MSVTRRLLSGWPAIHAPAIHLLLKPMRTHHLPRMRARPSTTPVLPDSSFSGSKMLCSGQKVPGSTRYSMRSQTLISPRSCSVCKGTPTFLIRSTSASMVFMISSIFAQFSRMLSTCLAERGFPNGSIFSKYCFMAYSVYARLGAKPIVALATIIVCMLDVPSSVSNCLESRRKRPQGYSSE